MVLSCGDYKQERSISGDNGPTGSVLHRVGILSLLALTRSTLACPPKPSIKYLALGGLDAGMGGDPEDSLKGG